MGNIIPSLIPDDVTFKAEFGLNDRTKALHDGSLATTYPGDTVVDEKWLCESLFPPLERVHKV